MNAKPERDAWQANISDQVHVFIIGATGSCSEFNGNFHLDIHDRGLSSCSWELPFVPKQQLFRAVFVANQTKNSTFEVRFQFEGSVRGPEWTASNISELSNTILLKLNPDTPIDKAIANGWPQHLRVSFSNSETAKKTFYIPPELNQDSMAMMSGLGALGNSGNCPQIERVSGSKGAILYASYTKHNLFECKSTNSDNPVLTATLKSGNCGEITWIIDEKGAGSGCSKTFKTPDSNTTVKTTYQIKCVATGEVLWGGYIRFTYVKGPVTTTRLIGHPLYGVEPPIGGHVGGRARDNRPNTGGASTYAPGIFPQRETPFDPSPARPCEP